MEEPEYRVFVRIPVPRPAGFIDPPSFVWNAEKESTLWNVISRRNRGDINCIVPKPSRILCYGFKFRYSGADD
jgi:hypothetical protein